MVKRTKAAEVREDAFVTAAPSENAGQTERKRRARRAVPASLARPEFGFAAISSSFYHSQIFLLIFSLT